MSSQSSVVSANEASAQIAPVQTSAQAQAQAHPAHQSVTPELRRWIVEQAQAGCRPEDVLAAMRSSGWEEAVAIAALESTLSEHLVHQGLPLPTVVVQAPASEVPEPLLAGSPAVLVAQGHAVRVLSTLLHPRVVVFGGLLSDDECEGLMALARPRLLRSETVVNQTGASEVNAARTSDGMFFDRGEHPLIARIEARIAALLNWPVENGEGLQVLRYGPGAQYRPHHDYFDPEHAGSATILKRGGQRVATLVMYLDAPQAGGSTTFPEIGYEVAPIRGNAVFFSYDRPSPTTRTLHGGAPVVSGEKWVATKWLREGVFV